LAGLEPALSKLGQGPLYRVELQSRPYYSRKKEKEKGERGEAKLSLFPELTLYI